MWRREIINLKEGNINLKRRFNLRFLKYENNMTTNRKIYICDKTISDSVNKILWEERTKIKEQDKN